MPIPPFPPCPPALNAAAYENIKQCVGVSHSDKIKHLTALDACAADLHKAEKAHESLRAGRLLEGANLRDVFDPDEGLGVLVAETTFIKYNAPLFSVSSGEMQNILDNAIAHHSKKQLGIKSTDSERSAAYSIQSAKIPIRSNGIVWLFRNPGRSRDAFDGLIDQWLGHRLGLIIPPSGEDRLTFSFLSARIDTPRRPTFYDAEWRYLPFWHYGGATKPLPGTPAGLSHLEEVVSIPPVFRDADPPLRRIRLKQP